MQFRSANLRSIALVLVVAGAIGACSVAPGASASPSPSPSPGANPTGEPGGFYLRAWQTQALEPHQTFTWLPILTINGSTLIDGRVAIPAIYPGPLYVSPFVRSITPAGISTIVAEARKAGLLGSKTDFTAGIAPGGSTGHLEMVVDGVRYEIAGDPAAVTRCRCVPDPGTAGAFAAFWQKLGSIEQWIPGELGSTAAYTPERLAVLVVEPAAVEAPITPNEATWPLGPFATFGRTSGNDRCAVVSGADLTALLPMVRAANQLTRFVDSAGVRKSLQLRALVPGEPTPCPA